MAIEPFANAGIARGIFIVGALVMIYLTVVFAPVILAAIDFITRLALLPFQILLGERKPAFSGLMKTNKELQAGVNKSTKRVGSAIKLKKLKKRK